MAAGDVDNDGSNGSARFFNGVLQAVGELQYDWKEAQLPPLSKKNLAKLFAVALTATGAVEYVASPIQAALFNRAAQKALSFSLAENPDARSIQAPEGPYDRRLGYTRADELESRLATRGYELVAKASGEQPHVLGIKIHPVYDEKSQTGLRIASKDTGELAYGARWPVQVYPDFESVPPLMLQSLLFVENRELLDGYIKTQNSAVEIDRTVKAAIDLVLRRLGLDVDQSGGSTLVQQLTKLRHSPGGNTGDSTSRKLVQILSASTKVYDDDKDTRNNSRRAALDYINSMPLGGFSGFGEVIGFADGMSLWFGADMEKVNRLLNTPEKELSASEQEEQAKAYRQALSLIMAVQRPRDFLSGDGEALAQRVDNFLPLLAKEGIISTRLRDLALATRVEFATEVNPAIQERLHQEEKFATMLRTALLVELGMDSLHDLDRMDLEAVTTQDGALNRAISDMLHNFSDPEIAAANGMVGYRLLRPENAHEVIYTLTLYERTPEGNVLRVQTDSYDGELNLNEGSRLERGSTSKARTKIDYLEKVEASYNKYLKLPPEKLQELEFHKDDRIARWVAEYLANPDTDKSRSAVLDAALDRLYSANPYSRFFTGGGLHPHFRNFKSSDDNRVVTVREAFHHSINLPFVRIMRDIVGHTIIHEMGVDLSILDNADHPERDSYLKKFADLEGTTFLSGFWRELKDKSPAEMAQTLAAKTARTPPHLAIIFRSIYPDAPIEEMAEFIREECENCKSKPNFEDLYETYAPGKFDLNDLGYVTGLHPLEIWLASYRTMLPDSSWQEIVSASEDVRLFVYKWLLKPRGRDEFFSPGTLRAQYRAIRTVLEREAFEHILKSWQEKGYPFETMTPSYASALGASGDTPAALAELVGILLNDGMRQPAVRFSKIRLGENTPYERQWERQPEPAVRVTSPEIARIVLEGMRGVVEQGTARRAHQAVRLSDGRILPVGVKTGTGDNRFKVHTSGGRLISSETRNRLGTAMFEIDGRFFGTVEAIVLGPEAANHRFTSSLPVQVLKVIASSPEFQRFLDRAYGLTPETELIAQTETDPAMEGPG